MHETGVKKIIFISSTTGHKISGGVAVYATAKHIKVLSEGLRQEVKPYNLRTTNMSPGTLDKFYKDFELLRPDKVDFNEIVYRPTRQDF